METRAVGAHACHHDWHHAIDVKTRKHACTCLIEINIFGGFVVHEVVCLSQADVHASFRRVHGHAHDAAMRADERTHRFHDGRA
eukprot:1623939-Prymnesium_polylepis.1